MAPQILHFPPLSNSPRKEVVSGARKHPVVTFCFQVLSRLCWILSFNSLIVAPSCLDFVLRSSTSESSKHFLQCLLVLVCIWLKRLSIVSSFSNFLTTASSFDPTPSAISKASKTSLVSEAVECAFASSFDSFSSGDGKESLEALTGFCVGPALKKL